MPQAGKENAIIRRAIRLDGEDGKEAQATDKVV